MLSLPAFEDLDAEQDVILDLPLDTSHLVTGPPGSGKTVMAIYRAQMFSVKKEPTLLLMYSKLLSEYTTAAVKKLGIEGAVRTYSSWFPRFFKMNYGADPPKTDDWAFDWKACWQEILKHGQPKKDRRHAVVDEGQDMPKDFYSVLRLVSPTVTVFADENQQLMDRHSTLDEIKGVLGLQEIHVLKRNHRNTRRIAEVAAHFYTGLRSGVAELPGKKNMGEKPVLVHHAKLNDTIMQIANFANLRPTWTIGVLLPYGDQQKQFYNRLAGKTTGPVAIYSSKKEIMEGRDPVDFARGGIQIVNYQSAKGLEFDAVFLPELQQWRTDTAGVEFKRKMYVMTSRARHQLFFLYTGEGRPPVVNALPLKLLEEL